MTRLAAAAGKGFTVPNVEPIRQYVVGLRAAVDSGAKLTEEQYKSVAAAKNYAAIQSQDVATQQVRSALMGRFVNDLDRVRQVQQKGLDVAQAKALAEDKANLKTIEQATLRVPLVQTEAVLLEKKLVTAGLESSELFKQTTAIKEQIALLEQKRAKGESITLQDAKDTQQMQQQLKILEAKTTTAVAGQPSKGGETFWERRFGWFVAGSAFYGTLKAAKDIAENLEKVETAMTQIKRVSNEPLADFTQMQKDLLDIGVQYGQTWDDVSKVAVEWARAGYSMKDTLELTKTSLLGMNTAELNTTQATAGLISVMAQWGLAGEQLLPVLDKINKTADNYAVSSGDLIDGLSRSSGAAKMLGMSLEEALGVLTVMRESSGRTGREVGNALNSILAFVQKTKSLKTMKDLGIDVGSGSQMRDVMDMFSEIATRWPSLSQEAQDSFVNVAESAGLYTEEIAGVIEKTEEFTQAQQRDLAVANAGTYRRNYFMALMGNFGKVVEVVTNMENALGYSEQENAKYLETYAAKVKQLQTAWVAFSDVFAQTGLLDQMKVVANAGRGLLGIFNALPPPMKAAAGAMIELAAAMTMVNLAKKTFGLGNFFEGIMNLGLKMGSNRIAEAGLAGATASFWQIAIPAAAFAALYAMIKAYVKAQEEMKKTAEQYHKSTQALSKTTEGTKEHDVALKNHGELLNLIGDKYPQLIAQMDDAGNVTAIYTGKIDKLNEAMGNTVSSSDDLKAKLAEVEKAIADLNAEWGRTTAYRYTPPSVMPGDLPEDSTALPTGPRDDVDFTTQLRALLQERARIDAALAEMEGGGSGGKGSTVSPDLEAAKSRFDSVTKSSLDLDLALISVRKSLRLVDVEEKSLGETMDDANKKKELAAQKAKLLARENDLLAATNGDLSSRLSVLNSLMSQTDSAISTLADGDDKDDWLSFQKSLTSEIKSTTQALADNTVSMRENQLEIQTSGLEVQEFYDKIRKAQKTLRDESLSNTKASIDYQVRMGAMNRDQQIAQLRQMLIIYADDAEKRREIEGDLQDLYRDDLEEQMDLVEKAYRQRIEWIDKEAQRKADKLQAEIDALDQTDEALGRTESERQHNEKILELQKQWNYEDLRLGKDHEKAKSNIGKQIEEENIRWSQQKRQWDLDDRRDALQKRIKDIQEAARKEKEALQKEWEDTKEAFSKNIAAIISTAAVFNNSWYQTGLTWGQQLAEGFKKGSVTAIQQANAQLNLGAASNEAGLLSRSHELLEAKKAWDRANELGDTEGMKRASEWGKWIRYAGPTLDTDNSLDSSELQEKLRNYPQAHTGALVTQSGVANLLKGEIVLNPQLSIQFARLADTLERNPSMSNHTTLNFAKGLVNVEEADLSNMQDIESLASLLFQRIAALRNSQGNISLGVLP